MSGLRTRKPTGQVAYPFILVEGDEGAGKTRQMLELSRSPRIGRMFVAGFGDAGVLDEYGPIGPYEIIDHNGMWSDFREQMELAMREPQVDGRPNVIGVDNVHLLWDALKDWTTRRAMNSVQAKRVLASDPDAAISVPSNYWNDANERWDWLITALSTYNGIVVVTARGKEVVKFEDGQIVANQRVWKVEGQKNLTFDARVWLRLRRDPRTAELIRTRSLHGGDDSTGKPQKLEPLDFDLLDRLVFERLGAGRAFSQAQGVKPDNGMSGRQAAAEVVSMLEARLGIGQQEARELGKAAWVKHGLGDPVEVPFDTVEAVVQVALTDYAAATAAASAAASGESPAQEAAGEASSPAAAATDEGGAAPGAAEAPAAESGGSEGWSHGLPPTIVAAVSKMPRPMLVAELRRCELPTNGTPELLKRRLAMKLAEEAAVAASPLRVAEVGVDAASEEVAARVAADVRAQPTGDEGAEADAVREAQEADALEDAAAAAATAPVESDSDEGGQQAVG